MPDQSKLDNNKLTMIWKNVTYKGQGGGFASELNVAANQVSPLPFP
jgi:hypothetical protein